MKADKVESKTASLELKDVANTQKNKLASSNTVACMSELTSLDHKAKVLNKITKKNLTT